MADLLRRRSPNRKTSRENPDANWRCVCCAKLLGVEREGHMHLSFGRGHEYLVGFPVTATCRGCGRLNKVSAPERR